MYEILKTLQIDFEREKVFNWSNNKQYDFYIPSLNCIIEMHGAQHYTYAFNQEAKVVQINDIYKKNLAFNQGQIQHYIEVDCKESNCSYIYNNLCQEKLLIELGILNIDIIQCDKNVRKFNSLYKEISDLWKSGLTTTEISNQLKYSKNTIDKYLHQASKLGMVDYKGRLDQNRKTKKTTIDLQTGKEYESILECSKAINKSRAYIQLHPERFKIKERNYD